MGIGKILGSISPAFGMASGKGVFGNKDVMGSISPLYGMMSGQGLGGMLGGMGGGAGGMGGIGLLMQLLGGQGQQGDEQQSQPLPGAMSAPQSFVDPRQYQPGGQYQNYLNMFGGG